VFAEALRPERPDDQHGSTLSGDGERNGRRRPDTEPATHRVQLEGIVVGVGFAIRLLLLKDPGYATAVHEGEVMQPECVLPLGNRRPTTRQRHQMLLGRSVDGGIGGVRSEE
jgi:hypothetical protein